MCHAYHEKRKTTNDEGNGTTKSRKNQNAPRKGNLQILGNIGSGHNQTSRDERKKLKKEYLRSTRKLLETNQLSRNLIKGINIWAIPTRKLLGTILKVDEGRTSKIGPENEKTHDDT